jgi:hypothetical protein
MNQRLLLYMGAFILFGVSVTSLPDALAIPALVMMAWGFGGLIGGKR